MPPPRVVSPRSSLVSAGQALAAQALVPVTDRVAELLRPQRTVSQFGDYGYEGEREIWRPSPVTEADLPALERQLALVTEAMASGDAKQILARILALLSHYGFHYGQNALPAAVEAALARDWLDDVGEFPVWIVFEACRRWRCHPSKYRYRPLPGDLRALCLEIAGPLPVMAKRLRLLLRAADAPTGIRAQIAALAAARRMPI